MEQGKKPIKLKVIPKETIWGGSLLKDYYNSDEFTDHVGITISVKCTKEQSNEIESGEYKGLNLYDLWINHKELFNSKYLYFPLIIGLVAPVKELSIQIHPTKEYAKKHNLTGLKNEAWYIINASEDSKNIYGVNAKNEKELMEYINADKWLDLVKYRPVKTEEFIYVPAGQLHTLGKNLLAYEVQDRTDITYRFYDYKRKDVNGNERPLHLKQAIECMDYNEYHQDLKYVERKIGDAVLTTFINQNDVSFVIERLRLDGKAKINTDKYYDVTVATGFGKINGLEVSKGDSFLFPANLNEYIFEGKMDVMLTSEK